ncbi:uncharacterized protein LOC141823967 isoform X1 [Curcuma longa]|uniref:uncharacterized protein LOC141823967 isoform X1 n=1 Tax=Curcuma longa TaxID=136217 RepID=UPI003D9F79A7
MSKTCIPTPVLRSIQLSLWIEGRIGRRLQNSSCLNPALRRQIPIGLARTADRDDSRPSNRRKGRIRSSYLNLSDGSGDKQAKFAPMEEFVEIRSGDGEAENIVTESTREGEGDGFEGSFPSTFDFLELKREFEKEEAASRLIGPEENDFIPPGGDGSVALESDESGELIQQVDAKGRRQMLKRSNLLAKQVISMRSARSLGFVSQLWVDTRSWMVVLVEVRLNFLSGDMEKFLLEDVRQVGDVVLVEDESVTENELKMIGLDTLVGYNVVTSGRRNVGKVRGYSFNINSGAVESLELDSFGFSIIPSSLVSTYCLLTEDVLEVVSDTVIVHEGAVSRVQRLTKGIWDAQNSDRIRDEIGEYFEFGRNDSPIQSRTRQKNATGRKPRRKMRESEDDWEFPMDY